MQSGPQIVMTLELSDGLGSRYAVAVGLSPDVAGHFDRRDVEELQLGLAGGFDQVVRMFRRREFRESAFIKVAANLGKTLAQRLADKEGWYGVERAEVLEEFGKDGKPR